MDIPIGLPAPETGAALVSGQWRTFKTTVALDVSVCVMADLLFAGRYRVKRRRAVPYIALEGESMLAARLSAIAGHRGVRGPLPFARRGDCPALTAKDAVTSLCAFADEAAADLDRSFGLPPQAVEPKHHQENSGTNDIEHPFAAH
ncbi:MAG: AAA family ATPase [Xanthobacteraceae bacterium]